MNKLLDRKLPPREYTIFHDVTLDTSRGPTQIDHIVLSRYGVFVIETKNYTGWIFGSARSRQWTQTIYKKKTRFQNPLRQNYKHVKAVESFFSLSSPHVHSVVVFVGDAEFRTDLPNNVTYYSGLCPYILSKRELILRSGRVREMATSLDNHKAGRDCKTPSATAIRVEPTLTVVQVEPMCPQCGEQMVRRQARQGKNAGTEFWGCPLFPKCRGTRVRRETQVKSDS